jgi:hypothetical protein
LIAPVKDLDEWKRLYMGDSPALAPDDVENWTERINKIKEAIATLPAQPDPADKQGADE